jgi:Flp pilus assembly protein TadD
MSIEQAHAAFLSARQPVSDKSVAFSRVTEPEPRERSKVMQRSWLTRWWRSKAKTRFGKVPGRQAPRRVAKAAHPAREARERGTLLLRRHRYAEAIEHLSTSIDMDPRDFLAYNDRGVAYTRLGQDHKAIEDFTQAIARNGRSFVTCRNRGVSHRRLGNLEQAIADLTHAIALNPRYAPAYQERGDAYTRLGDVAMAQADYEKALWLGLGGRGAAALNS